MLRGGIPMSTENFPDMLSQQILAGRFFVGRLRIARTFRPPCARRRRATSADPTLSSRLGSVARARAPSCENLWESVRIYEDLWESVGICENLWEYMIICEHLSCHAVIFENLWCHVRTCENTITVLSNGSIGHMLLRFRNTLSKVSE